MVVLQDPFVGTQQFPYVCQDLPKLFRRGVVSQSQDRVVPDIPAGGNIVYGLVDQSMVGNRDESVGQSADPRGPQTDDFNCAGTSSFRA